MYKKVDEEDHTPREICLKEFLEALHELKFQALDSEFELSRKLPLVCSDIPDALTTGFLILEYASFLAEFYNTLRFGLVFDYSPNASPFGEKNRFQGLLIIMICLNWYTSLVGYLYLFYVLKFMILAM